MKERIKILRKHLNITQEEFAKQIGIKRNTLANYEIGRNEPIDAVIFSICRVFRVNEDWLRNGTGNMYKEEPADDDIALYASMLLENDSENDEFVDLIIDIMKTYKDLNEPSKMILREYSQNLIKNISKRKEGN